VISQTRLAFARDLAPALAGADLLCADFRHPVFPILRWMEPALEKKPLSS
jgi:hypothetical protein